MVTTFSARLVSLTNKCNSIIGKRKSFDIDAIDINNTQNYKRHNYSVMKRQGAFDSEPHRRHHHHHHHHPESPGNKRKRQKEELQYTAATIQSALQAADRPPMSILGRRRERALPIGSVNSDAAKVIYSSEYDKLENPFYNDQKTTSAAGSITSSPSSSQQQSKSDSEIDQSVANNNESPTNQDDEDAYYNEMNYASLIISTRTYYKNNFQTAPTSNFTVSNTKVTQSANKNNDVDKNSDSSEGLSSWTPNSSSHDFMNDKKNIDNDNRSDDISSVNAEDSSSDSSLCQSPMPPSALKEERNSDSGDDGNRNNNSTSAFTVVG